MSDITRVVIGIQARSGSSRFPNKVLEKIGGKTVLKQVIETCQDACRYLNRYVDKKKTLVTAAVCIPEGDSLRLSVPTSVPVIEGHELDVLSRYWGLIDQLQADYVVRITADCPLIPAFLISKHVTIAVMNQYDYVSNVDESCRTAPDGWDCEVISKRALEYAHKYAIDPLDREHVTTYLRRSPPDWMRRGMIINFLNLSHLKLSLDTPDDLDRMRKEADSVEQACQTARTLYGKSHVHRL